MTRYFSEKGNPRTVWKRAEVGGGDGRCWETEVGTSEKAAISIHHSSGPAF